MVEHVQPAMFDQVDPGELHDLPDPFFIVTLVALGLALLAHWFGIVGTLHPHGEAVCEKLAALGAERDLFLVDLFDVEKLKGERRLLHLVMLPAEYGDELHQYSNVVLLLVRDSSLLYHLQLLHTKP